MRSDRYNKKEKKKSSFDEAGGFVSPRKKKGGIFRFIGILFLILGICFFGALVYAGFLPLHMLLIAGVCLLLVIILLGFPLLSCRFKRSRRILASIFAILCMGVFGIGLYFLASTLNFIDNITNIASSHTVSYAIIVRDDDAYNDLTDLSGEEVPYFHAGGIERAMDKILQETDINFILAEDEDGAADALLAGDWNALLMKKSRYRKLCESRKDFQDDTKILYTCKITEDGENVAKPVKVTREPFNVLISGLDITGNINEVSRSDVNMVATVNPRTKTVLLTSIPRDYYVELPSAPGEYDKLTHTGLNGIEETQAAVENLLGIDINYYIKVNFSTVPTLVDALGGIDVESEYDFYAKKDATTDFHYNKGMNHLDGAQTLAFVRERNSFEDGDFQRNRDQQLALKAILKKLTSSRTLLFRYGKILNAVEPYVQLNMSERDIKALVSMQIINMSGWKIKMQNITGGIDMLPSYLAGGYASVVTQDEDSIAAAVKGMDAVREG